MAKPINVEEVKATAMLLGEPIVECKACDTTGTMRGIFGGKRRCTCCGGCGFVEIGTRTCEMLKIVIGPRIGVDRRIF